MQTDINMSAMDIRFFVVRFRARAFKMFVNYLEGNEKFTILMKMYLLAFYDKTYHFFY